MKLMNDHRFALQVFQRAIEILEDEESSKALQNELSEDVYKNLAYQLRISIKECQSVLESGGNAAVDESTNVVNATKRHRTFKESEYTEDATLDQDEYDEDEDNESVYAVGLGVILVAAAAGFIYSYMSSSVQR